MNSFIGRLLIKPILGVGTVLTLLASPCWAQTNETASLLQAAQHGALPDRYVAIDDLGERHVDAKEVVPVLTKLLADSDVQVRWRSARALGDYGPLAQDAAAELRKLLAGDDPRIKYHASVALGRIGDRSDETIRALIGVVTGSDGPERRAAVAALRALKPDPEVFLPVVQRALDSDDPTVAVHALEALIEQGAAAVPFLNAALGRTETAYLACTAIAEIGPDAAATVPALVELLGKTSHSQLQIQALVALANIGPAARPAAPQVINLLETSTDATVPAAAAYALGAVGAPNADAPLAKALTREEPFIQMAAAWALAKLHPHDEAAMRRAVDKLTNGLKSDDAQIRIAAAKGLQMLQPPPEIVAPALVAIVDDPDPEVAANVVDALVSLGEAVVPRASRALQNPEYRPFALRVLTRLGPKAEGAVAALTELIPDASPDDCASIHFALAAIGPGAAPATDALVQGLANEDKRVRHSALYALRMIGPAARSSVPSLLKLIAGEDAFDAQAAAWALASIAPTDASVAAKIVPVLMRGLSSPEENVRAECAEALGTLGPAAKQAATALARLAQEDDSLLVRESAAAAAAQIGN